MILFRTIKTDIYFSNAHIVSKLNSGNGNKLDPWIFDIHQQHFTKLLFDCFLYFFYS